MSKNEKKFISDNCHRLKDLQILATLNKLRMLAGESPLTLVNIRETRQDLGFIKAQGARKCEIVEIRNRRTRMV